MSEEPDKSQQTEQPTSHRLEKAEKEGQVALSKEVSHFFLLLAFALLLVYSLPSSFHAIVVLLRGMLEAAPLANLETLDLNRFMAQTVGHVGYELALPALMLVIAVLVAGFAQTGFNISAEHMKPKLSKVSPMQGLKKLFGVKALFEFLKNILKVMTVVALTYYAMEPQVLKLSHLTHLTIPGFLDELTGSTLKFLTIVISLIGVVAILDYGYQKWMFIRGLRMSRQEIKEEYKELEGDPHVKSRVRQIREQRARQRMMSDVPKATVVIMNPTHYAVALRYDMDAMNAPEVVAMGLDSLALRIKQVAEENDVPILQNPPLARALYKEGKIGQEIPMAYYEIVAKVIRYVYGLDRRAPDTLEG